MKRCILCTAALLTMGMFAMGCRKTEVVTAPPREHVVTPQPTVIEHDRPVIIEHH